MKTALLVSSLFASAACGTISQTAPGYPTSSTPAFVDGPCVERQSGFDGGRPTFVLTAHVYNPNETRNFLVQVAATGAGPRILQLGAWEIGSGEVGDFETTTTLLFAEHTKFRFMLVGTDIAVDLELPAGDGPAVVCR